jgi:hypothetical protein
MLLIVISGLFAGLLHSVSGPDHLTAVTPLAVNDKRRGWLTGWLWGLGHTTGVIAIAMAAVGLRDWLPPIEVLSQWSERLVGAALIGVGLWALRRAAQIETRTHGHRHATHSHMHVRRGPGWLLRHGHTHASFALGSLHGIAGSSHLFGVLPALALPSRTASLVYIGAFGAGTVAAMTIFTAVVGHASARYGVRAVPRRGLMLASSLGALAVGGFWLLA